MHTTVQYGTVSKETSQPLKGGGTYTEPLLSILCACQVPVHAELQVPLLGPDRVPDGEGEQQQQQRRRVPWVLIPPPPHAPDPPTQPGEEAAQQRWPAATRLARAQLNRWAHIDRIYTYKDTKP